MKTCVCHGTWVLGQTLVPGREITLWLGKLDVKIAHLGTGPTKGDTVVWRPSQKVLFSGDLVEYDAACYCGDAQPEEWSATLEALERLKQVA